jgi:hypothetical protein
LLVSHIAKLLSNPVFFNIWGTLCEPLELKWRETQRQYQNALFLRILGKLIAVITGNNGQNEG